MPDAPSEQETATLRAELERLRQRDRELTDFIENGAVALHWVDARGIIVWANQAELALLGYTRDEYIGQHIARFHADADAVADMLQRLTRNETLHNHAVRLRAKDGSIKEVLISSNVQCDGDRFLHTRCLTRDVTELKRAENALRQSEERLRVALDHAEEASRLKDDFLAVLSHELRTPLNAILGWSHMLRAGMSEPKAVSRALETIERNARVQAQLIEDLLDVSRIASGRLRLEMRPVGVAEVAAEAIETVRPTADARAVRLVDSLDRSVGPVSGDANRLQQVFWNLLSNSIKFTPRGGQVDVVVEPAGANVRITVSDTGQGIDPSFLPHVFDRFRQGRPEGKSVRVGLGLGLAIVRHLVEAHGGTVDARSEGSGKGATFTVELPVLEGAVPRQAPDSAPAPPLAMEVTMSLAGVRVLVVEDEPDACELLLLTLGERGAEVTIASTTDEASALLDSACPDVLVSDIELPGGSGYELIKRVRQSSDEVIRRVPAVALTAHARTEDRVRALLAGFDTHVPKPVEPAELVTVIASLVNKAS
jgi:PAS domain S-box-containing protein